MTVGRVAPSTHRECGVLVLSHDALTPAGEDLTDAGCDRILRDPCSPDVLAHELHGTLSVRRRA